ncbi:hypothetical protein G7Y79_00072g097830 [Physcia stellaris]|nr:hypothetical protein G7Y79_00072g097830 [Physcia stellaris]
MREEMLLPNNDASHPPRPRPPRHPQSNNRFSPRTLPFPLPLSLPGPQIYIISTSNPYQRRTLTKAFPIALHLAHLASTSPAISESTRRRIALNYFPASSYALAKRVFQNILGTPRNLVSGDPRLADIKVDVDDSKHLCSNASVWGDGSEFLAHMNTGPRREKTLTVCKGFWNAYGGRTGRWWRGAVGMWAQLHLDWVKPASELNTRVSIPSPISDHKLRNEETGKVEYLSAPEEAYIIRDAGGPWGALTNARNYEMFALELYWTHRCKHTFAKPTTLFEGVNGYKDRRPEGEL